MKNREAIDQTVDQGIAAYVEYLKNIRLNELAERLTAILENEKTEIGEILKAEAKAIKNLDFVEKNVEDIVKKNRGGATGMHGFIAEFAEAGITNARRSLEGLRSIARVLNDNGPADLHFGKSDVQMKFYADMKRELKQSINYRDMKMMFPKDHYEVFQKAMAGDKYIEYRGNRLTLNEIEKIRNLIEEESKIRQEPYTKWMKPSKLTYDEVQKDAIQGTLHKEKESIEEQVTESKNKIHKDADEKRNAASVKAKPTLDEAAKVAGTAAAVQGGMNFLIFVYDRHKDGKEIWQFDKEDWKQAGVKTGKGAVKGGISGASIYGLTNVCKLSAPSAGAITTGTFGLINAVIDYRAGKLDDDGFIDAVMFNAIDSAGAAIGAAFGQTLIPVPVLGAVVGSIAVSTMLSAGKGILNRKEQKVLRRYQNDIDKYIKRLDKKYQDEYKIMMGKYEALGELQKFAFDLERNVQLRFISSIELAENLGVEEEKILHNLDEINDYFN